MNTCFISNLNISSHEINKITQSFVDNLQEEKLNLSFSTFSSTNFSSDKEDIYLYPQNDCSNKIIYASCEYNNLNNKLLSSHDFIKALSDRNSTVNILNNPHNTKNSNIQNNNKDSNICEFKLNSPSVINLNKILDKITVPKKLQKATIFRQNEYLCGRYLLALLLSLYGSSEYLSPNANSPLIFSNGFLASITHDNNKVVVAVTQKSNQIQHIGIDLCARVDTETAQNIQTLVMSTQEEFIIKKLDLSKSLVTSNNNIQIVVALLFSAKEALYKATYPIHQSFLEFLDAELIDLEYTKKSTIGIAGILYFNCKKINQYKQIPNNILVHFKISNNNVFTTCII